jgi:polysaccharide biosynthesis protein PslG
LKYVEATVTRYKDVVDEWEIWNEPYGQEKDYAPLMIATAERIKKIQPNAVTLGEIGWWKDDKCGHILMEAMKASNKLDLIDYWAYHPYDENPDACYPQVEKLAQFVQSYNPKYRLYQGEAGCPSSLEWTHALSNYPWTEYSQAKWNLRRMAGDRVRNIPSSVFTIIDLRYCELLQSFGLIRSNLLHEIIYKRPAYYAVQHMAGFFDDSVTSIGELKYESNSPRKMTIAGFRKEGKSVVLVWYNDRIPSDELKWDMVDVTIKKAIFQNPVYVEMITGKVFEIDKSAWKTEGDITKWTQLPVWDSPVMIAERSQVELRKDGKD